MLGKKKGYIGKVDIVEVDEVRNVRPQFGVKLHRIKECFLCKNKDVILRDKRTGRYVCENHIFHIQPKEAREEV